MTAKYLVYEDTYDFIPWTCDEFKSASIMVNDLEKHGKNPQIYQLIYANGEMQNGKK